MERCIQEFLEKTDRIYDAKRQFGFNLFDSWKDKNAPKHVTFLNHRADDGVVHGDAATTLIPSADWRIVVVDDNAGLEEVATHLEEIDEQGSVSLDTEGA